MSWRGRVIGLLIGLLTRRWQLVVIGLALGYLYDRGVFGAGAGAGTRSAPPPPPPAGVPDPYATLGVDASASDDAVETAYRRGMSDHHPDRVATASPEIRASAERRARELNQAYDEIKRRRGLH